MKTPALSLEALEGVLSMLMGLSEDNRQWLAARLIEPTKKPTRAKAKAKVTAENFNEFEAESWERLGFTPESAASIAIGCQEARDGKYAFRGTAEEFIKHYA